MPVIHSDLVVVKEQTNKEKEIYFSLSLKDFAEVPVVQKYKLPLDLNQPLNCEYCLLILAPHYQHFHGISRRTALLSA